MKIQIQRSYFRRIVCFLKSCAWKISTVESNHHLFSFWRKSADLTFWAKMNWIDKNHIDENTWNHSVIIITLNVRRSFYSTRVLETGLSIFFFFFFLMTVIVTRKNFKNSQPKLINYRSYQNFPNCLNHSVLCKIANPLEMMG